MGEPNSASQPDNMNARSKAYLVGGGIGSLAAAAFMIRDGGVPGGNISILETLPVMGGVSMVPGMPRADILCAADAC